MADELMRDLPSDLPTFLTRFGTDAQCRAYLVRARWPESLTRKELGDFSYLWLV